MKRMGELSVQALPVVKMHPSNQLYEPQNFLAAGDLVDALVAKVDASPYFDVQGEIKKQSLIVCAKFLSHWFSKITVPSNRLGIVSNLDCANSLPNLANAAHRLD
jgi:hypothetical protein